MRAGLRERLTPRSLRARLLAGLLSVTAVTLVLLTATLYAQQQRFAYDRIDDQARAAVFAVNRALNDNGVEGALPGRGGDTPRNPGQGQGEGPMFPAPPPGAGQRGPAAALPPNVYGQRRSPEDKVLGSVLVGYSGDAPSPPKLPATVKTGDPFTVDAADGGGHYRVYAEQEPNGTVTIAAVPLTGVTDQLQRLVVTEALLVGCGLILMGLLGAWVVGVALRPLDAMGSAAGAIAAGDLSRRVTPDDERTEVGRLGKALNAMLAQIETAFSKQEASEDHLRRFLADASHELRTPLASIRGYAELHRMGAASEPAAVDHAMSRIEAESARMGVLVEDLLTLARQDEHREPIRTPVLLAQVAADAVSDATATDQSGRVIELAVDDAGDGTAVLGDPDALHQLVTNLLRNALVHTPDGTPIELGVMADAEHVTLTIRDHGPGLPEGDHAQLFERFWRAAPGRERGPAGAGLGLAIAAGIVELHDGTISAEDADGGGARFTVVLPRLAD